MSENASRSVAVVGVGAVLPDAPNAPTFWENLKNGRYSITETPDGRWDPALYYDPDPHAPDKTYSKIGGWVRDYEWSPLEWRLPVPPRVGEAMDRGQKWSVGACREALLDYGYPDRALDTERTAVVLGNAMAGDQHYLTALPIYLPEYVEELDHLPSFAALPASARRRRRRGAAGGHPPPPSRNQRRQHAGRAGQHHRRAGGQPARPPRSQLHRRRRLRVGVGGRGRRHRGARTGRLRRRADRRCRRQHERQHLRQVLQDRGAVRHRDASRTTTAPTAS